MTSVFQNEKLPHYLKALGREDLVDDPRFCDLRDDAGTPL